MDPLDVDAGQVGQAAQPLQQRVLDRSAGGGRRHAHQSGERGKRHQLVPRGPVVMVVVVVVAGRPREAPSAVVASTAPAVVCVVVVCREKVEVHEVHVGPEEVGCQCGDGGGVAERAATADAASANAAAAGCRGVGQLQVVDDLPG